MSGLTVTLLAALPFVNPLLLSGLGVAVLPILIHLLSRRRFRRIEWGAMRFLFEAEQENRRRKRFEQWILVALRCLALALLALMFSRPFLQPGVISDLLGAQATGGKILVIDDSASMQDEADGRTGFARAQQAAGRLLEWLAETGGGQLVSVFRASEPDMALIDQEALSIASLPDLVARIDDTSPTAAAADPRRVLARVVDEARALRESGSVEIYVLSDFQRTDWSSAEGASAFDVLTAESALADRVVLVDCGAGPRGNLAMTGLRLVRPQVIAGLPQAMTLELANFGDSVARNVGVALDISGSAGPRVVFDEIAPNARATQTVELAWPEVGAAIVTARLESPEGFSLDDVRRTPVLVRDAIRVLLVSGDEATDSGSAGFYLRNALAPAGPFSSGIETTSIGVDALEATDLAAFDLVVLANAPTPESAAIAGLSRFVRGGGGLVVFLGNAIRPDLYNASLYDGGRGLLPAELIRRRSIDPTRVAPVGIVRAGTHPLTAIFPADADDLGEAVRVREFFEVRVPSSASREAETEDDPDARSPDAQGAAEVLAAFTDARHAPAVVLGEYGCGRVLLFTTSADASWSNWPRAADGSYVITMLETIGYVSRRSAVSASFDAGAPLALVIDPDRYAPRANFLPPDYPDRPALPATIETGGESASAVRIVSAPAQQLGIFEVELTTRGGATERRPLAVNLPNQESDLRVLSPDALGAALRGVPHEIVSADQEFFAANDVARREWWSALAVLVVAVLVLEQTLAWWFGRAGGAPRKKPATGMRSTGRHTTTPQTRVS